MAKYDVRSSRFHGGLRLSSHHSLKAAKRQLARETKAHGECTCGGPQIVPGDAGRAAMDGTGHYSQCAEPGTGSAAVWAEIEREARS